MGVTYSLVGLWFLWKVLILALAHYSYLRCHCYLFSKTLPHSITREKFLFSLRQLLHLRNFWYVLE